MYSWSKTLAAVEVLCSGRASVFAEAPEIWVFPNGGRSPVCVTVTSDHVSIRAGFAARVGVPAQEPTAIEDVTDVLAAIAAGRFEEYFGTSTGRSWGYLGHRVWWPTGARQALDEHVHVLHTSRPSAWSD